MKAQLFGPTEKNVNCGKNENGTNCYCETSKQCVLCYRLTTEPGSQIKRVPLNTQSTKRSRNCDDDFMLQFNFDNVPMGKSNTKNQEFLLI